MASENDRPLTAEEYEIAQYDAIVAMHDAIMAGTHPRIKPSSQLVSIIQYVY